MPPKKDNKKQAVEEQPQELAPPPPHELQGYAKFQYIDGMIYEGSWKIIDGVKYKHGFGILLVKGPSNRLFDQKYQGSWKQDQKFGYGVYNYPNGAIYKGEWLNDQHHGKGIYEFPNGTIYDGDWQNHKMHGYGKLTQSDGRIWSGQFRKGSFNTKLQKQLMKQKNLNKLIIQIEASVNQFINEISKKFKGDKPIDKVNDLQQWFYAIQNYREMIHTEIPKLQSYTFDQWKLIFTSFEKCSKKILKHSLQSTFIDSTKIFKDQLAGKGQIVQIISTIEDKQIKTAFINLQNNKWGLIYAQIQNNPR